MIRRTVFDTIAVLIIATFLGFTVYFLQTPARADLTSQRTWDRHRVNAVRADHGRRPVRDSARLDYRAQRWAQYLADHRTLADDSGGAKVCWALGGSTYGSNVAVGPSIRADEYALEQSTEHLSNIIDRRFRRVGIGIAHSNGSTWLVQDFCG